jgi:CheY-like chemotaxis protein
MTKDPKNTTIFLVDDDDFHLDMYSLKFRNAGFIVEIAKTTDDALHKLREGFKPDIIMSDIVMPKMDGFEFLSIVKKEKLAQGAKCVILSNLGQPEEIEKGKALGAVDYIVKASNTPSEVLEKIKKLV